MDEAASQLGKMPILEQTAPSIALVNADRIKVTTMSGRCYEADRWCPHKRADLSKGTVIGESLVCPKHDWEFELDAGGLCRAKNASIHAILDW